MATGAGVYLASFSLAFIGSLLSNFFSSTGASYSTFAALAFVLTPIAFIRSSSFEKNTSSDDALPPKRDLTMPDSLKA